MARGTFFSASIGAHGAPIDTACILKAVQFAAIKHSDQRRKDRHASPYIIHPIDLACTLVLEGAIHDQATIIAGLLHDVLETTRTTKAEIELVFGAEVASIVEEVTDDWRLARAERKRRQILGAASLSSKAQLVRLADKISNVRDIHSGSPVSWDGTRKRQYIDQAKQVVDRMRGICPELERIFDDLCARSLASEEPES